MSFEIENVPYRRASATDTFINGFPFASLEVGQRFFVADGEGGKRRPIPVKAAASKLGYTFKVQDDVKNGATGRYVYRTA